MQWSAAGGSLAAVVGYNTGTQSFYNHPLSGFSSIGESISCTVERRRQKKESEIQASNVILQPQPDLDIQRKAIKCRIKVQEDINRFSGHDQLISLISLLQPCPCTVNQARQDVGRFVKFSEDPLCYISVPVYTSVNVPVTLTHQCCYENGYGYSMILILEC